MRVFHLLVLALLLTLASGTRAKAATIVLDDGGTHVVNTPSADSYDVYDGPGSQPTTLRIEAGADLTGSQFIRGSSILEVSGGVISGGGPDLYDTSSGSITGGTFLTAVILLNSSSLVVDGSTQDQLAARHDSSLSIRSVQMGASIYSGVYVEDSSSVSFYGSGLVLTDVVDDVFPASWDKQHLTGFFEDASVADLYVFFKKSDPGTVQLFETPEPGTGLLVMAGLLGLAGRRRRRLRVTLPALRRSCLALVLLGIWISGPAHALPIQNAFGLVGPDTALSFDEWGADGVAIEAQYAAQGVTFSTPLYTLYSDNFAGMTSHALNGNGTFEIQFGGVVTEAAFAFLTNPGTSTFRALLGGVLVDEFAAATTYSFNGSGSPTFFGFEGVAFDAIEVVAGGQNGAFRLDTLQFGPVAAPEPGSLALVAMGLMGLGLGRRRG